MIPFMAWLALAALPSAARPVAVAMSHCTARRESPAHVYKERVYHELVAARNASLARALKTRQFERAPKSYFFIEPEYSCDIDLRVGNVIGDGAQFVCNPHHIQEQAQCLYYGFGVDNNIAFEKALPSVVQCDMHTFDPTPRLISGPVPARLEALGIHFHGWALSSVDGKIKVAGAEVQAYTLDTIRTKLQHTARAIDILKIDTEGGEWSILSAVLRTCDPQHPVAHQILVELHAATQEGIIALYDNLTRCGYRTFHKDPNLYTTTCMEYAFVHWRFLKCM